MFDSASLEDDVTGVFAGVGAFLVTEQGLWTSDRSSKGRWNAGRGSTPGDCLSNRARTCDKTRVLITLGFFSKDFWLGRILMWLGRLLGKLNAGKSFNDGALFVQESGHLYNDKDAEVFPVIILMLTGL